MTPRCKRCNSRSIVYDRSLGGRPVCSACGTPISETKGITSSQSRSIGRAPGTLRQTFSFKTAIAWILPISLVGCYVYLTANPRAVSHWLAPYSPSSRDSWWIRTPADIELLIDQAQKADSEIVDPSVHDTVRELITRLKAKGVRLLISDRVMEHAGGVWDPGLAEIRLRPSTVTMGSMVLAEALAHESAHVALGFPRF
jgi:ribosomal protein S27E